MEKDFSFNLLGKKVNFKVLENNLTRKWSKKGSIPLVDMADGYFLVHFMATEDYNLALFEGPWLVADHYLIVQRWVPIFLQNAEQPKKVAVWVRIPRLPLELYNARFLWRIGSHLGSMLKIDKLTSIHSRGQFARICVEMDLEKPLCPFIVIRGHKLLLEYEGLHLICFNCGRYGHKSNKCVERIVDAERIDAVENSNPVQNVVNKVSSGDGGTSSIVPDGSKLVEKPIEVINNVVPEGAEMMKESDDGYGAWMVVKRNHRKKNQTRSSKGSKKVVHESKNSSEASKKASKSEKVKAVEVKDFGDPQANLVIQESIGARSNVLVSDGMTNILKDLDSKGDSLKNTATSENSSMAVDEVHHSSKVYDIVQSFEKGILFPNSSEPVNVKVGRTAKLGKVQKAAGKGMKVIQSLAKKKKSNLISEASSKAAFKDVSVSFGNVNLKSSSSNLSWGMLSSQSLEKDKSLLECPPDVAMHQGIQDRVQIVVEKIDIPVDCPKSD